MDFDKLINSKMNVDKCVVRFSMCFIIYNDLVRFISSGIKGENLRGAVSIVILQSNSMSYSFL